MYGMMIPILYPIALFAFINLYINERLGLAYYYQQPPVYDDEFIRTIIPYMKAAPLFMFTLGYWAMGNRQLFYNLSEEQTYANQKDAPTMIEHGTWDQLMVVFLAGCFNVFYLLFNKRYAKCFKRIKETIVDKKLGSFWSNL
jgi:hypothetical protein